LVHWANQVFTTSHSHTLESKKARGMAYGCGMGHGEGRMNNFRCYLQEVEGRGTGVRGERVGNEGNEGKGVVKKGGGYPLREIAPLLGLSE